jgi:amidase
VLLPDVTIPADRSTSVFDRVVPPAATVDAGAVVRFETDDHSFARLAAGETLADIGHDRVNRVTGPLAVRGARPGDALIVEILDVEVATAWAAWLPGFGHLGAHTTETRVRRLELRDDRIVLAPGLTIPTAPMIGCLGLAPAEGTGSAVRPLYRLGGNLDLVEARSGTAVVLPVEVDGGLLSVGDLHAAQGVGEGAFVAIEAAGAATVRLEVERGAAPPAPRLRRPGETIVVGLGVTHVDATRHALEQAYALLCERDGLDADAAYAYVCAAVDLRPCGPAGSLLPEGLQGALAVVPDPPVAAVG